MANHLKEEFFNRSLWLNPGLSASGRKQILLTACSVGEMLQVHNSIFFSVYSLTFSSDISLWILRFCFSFWAQSRGFPTHISGNTFLSNLEMAAWAGLWVWEMLFHGSARWVRGRLEAPGFVRHRIYHVCLQKSASASHWTHSQAALHPLSHQE